ncbi:hypothetical protein F5Y14DRAFT_287440 [Nemania sp. NC0429]|nr:hypothetical protein F5Y14DRAFT_287440 [Nemania sp. NC0429]
MANKIHGRVLIMCHYLMIEYQCRCVKISEFVQCQDAKDTKMNIKCKPIEKKLKGISPNYCENHLVYQSAAKKFRLEPGPGPE